MIDFPSNPANGDVFTSGNSSWVWNAAASQWRTAIVALNPKVQRLSGDGTTVQFTLNTTPPNTNFLDLYISGIYQQKNTYSISGTTLTFTEAPPSGTDNIEVEWGSTLDIGTPSDASVTAAKLTSTAITDKLGYTPLNKAGDTLTGLLNLGSIGQIKFPATQNASSDANTLDDYEEGTWTPSFTGDGSNPTITYNTRLGTYVKIGRIVYFSFRFYLTSKSGGSGNLFVSGLPFTIISSEDRGMTFSNFSYAWAGSIGRNPILMTNTNSMAIYTDVNGTTNAQTQVSDLGSNTYFQAGGFYYTST